MSLDLLQLSYEKPPKPKELAEYIDSIAPSNFKRGSFDRTVLYQRKPGGQIKEGMNIMFKDKTTTVYVRVGSKFLRHVCDENGGCHTVVLERRGI